MWTASAARERADTLFDRLVENWERVGDDMPPLGFLFHTYDDGSDVCSLISDVGNYPKEAVPDFLRSIADITEASFVGYSGCAYVVCDLTQEAAKAWLDGGRSLSEHPNAVDSLMLTVDGPGLSIMYRAWQSGGTVQREVTEDEAHEGRFTNLSGRMGEN